MTPNELIDQINEIISRKHEILSVNMPIELKNRIEKRLLSLQAYRKKLMLSLSDLDRNSNKSSISIESIP
jgi:hypothetical protein